MVLVFRRKMLKVAIFLTVLSVGLSGVSFGSPEEIRMDPASVRPDFSLKKEVQHAIE